MQNNLAVDAVYSAINTLPKKMQIDLIEKVIFNNDLLQDLIDICIAKERMKEEDSDYEAIRRARKGS